MTIPDISRAARPLLESYGFTSAVLFGSHARGDADEGSDVDVFVTVPRGTKTNKVFAFAYDLGEALGVDVDAYGSHEVDSSSDFFREIQRFGVAL